MMTADHQDIVVQAMCVCSATAVIRVAIVDHAI